MPTDRAGNKRRLAEFLHQMSQSDGVGIDVTLAALLRRRRHLAHPSPLQRLHGSAEVAARFWAPLRAAFADWEARMAFFIAGDYEGREVVSTWGVLMGNLGAP